MRSAAHNQRRQSQFQRRCNVLSKLILRNFKNFRDAELTLGPLSLLVGTNASGKSNLRDAFRFLHGISLWSIAWSGHNTPA